VNEASLQGMFICKYELLITDRLNCEGSEKPADAQQETYEAFQTVTPIYEVRRALLGKARGS